MASSNSQIDKPQCGCPKRAELLVVNIKTGAQSINTERALRLLTCTGIRKRRPDEIQASPWTLSRRISVHCGCIFQLDQRVPHCPQVYPCT